jgi:hypothetical protein
VTQIYPWAAPYVAPSTATKYYVAPNGVGTIGTTGCVMSAPCSIALLSSASLSSSSNGTVVYLRGGTYYLTQPITPAVGGFSSTVPIVYAAYPGETPIITGAQPLTGWSLTTTAACAGISNCYSTTIPTGFVDFEYLLYVSAGWPQSYTPYVMTRRTQALSTPSSYNLITLAVPKTGTCHNTGGSNPTCTDRVVVNASDLPASWTSATCGSPGPYHCKDIKFYNFPNSDVDALQISSLATSYNGNPALTELFFTSASDYGFAPNKRYIIANSREYFHANATPGTFYLDCGTLGDCVNNMANIGGATLYYIANTNENPMVDTIYAPQVTPLIADGNTGSGMAPAVAGQNNLTLYGLVFVADNYVPGASGYVSVEGSYTIPAALSFVDTSYITLNACIIGHTSGWGLEFTNDNCNSPGTSCDGGYTAVLAPSKANYVLNSALYDIGTSGVRLGRYPPDGSDSGNSSSTATTLSEVENNLFVGMGRMYPGGEDGCIWIGSSNTNTVQSNQCSDSYGGGIEVGPGVGGTSPDMGIYQDYAYNNTVSGNSFGAIGEGVIVDFGCVHFANFGGYANPPTPNNGDIFQYNICHDITHAVGDNPGNGGTGIYIDTNSQYVQALDNLVYRASGSLFFNNGSPSCPSGGCNNLVSNNIFAYSYQGPVQRGFNPNNNNGGEGDSILDFTFTHNIVYYDTAQGGAGNGPQSLQPLTSFWTCFGAGSFSPPCYKFFAFSYNDYYSASGITPGFVVTGMTNQNPTSLQFSPGWQTSPYDEDTGTNNQVNPNFVAPYYPSDNYMFGVGGPPGTFTPIPSTYLAGRTNALIYAPAVSPGFPLQLLSPFQF